MARRWCKPLRPLYNFIWSTWFWQGSGLLTPRDSVFIPMYNKKYISKPENKTDQFLERLIPLCRSFFPLLAEFPSGAWVPTMSTYLPWFSSPREKEPKEGHLPIFKWRRWPNVDGANSLSWSFIGIPHKPSYSAFFSPLIFLLHYSLISLYISN